MNLKRQACTLGLMVALLVDFGCSQSSQGEQFRRDAGFGGFLVGILGGLAITRCGSSNPKVTDVQGALTSNPDGSPITLDTANSGASSISKARNRPAFGGVSLDLKLTKAAGSGSSFGQIKGFQCRNDSQQSYFTLDITNVGTDATYVGGGVNLPV